jgi:hypothetical protein
MDYNADERSFEMKVETNTAFEPQAVILSEDAIIWPEPQSEWGVELLGLLKAIDESGIPKLSEEEIEDYLERSRGPAFPDETLDEMMMTTTASA